MTALPLDMLASIFFHLPSKEILRLGSVCKDFLEVTKEDETWKYRALRYLSEFPKLMDSWRDHCFSIELERKYPVKGYIDRVLKFYDTTGSKIHHHLETNVGHYGGNLPQIMIFSHNGIVKKVKFVYNIRSTERRINIKFPLGPLPAVNELHICTEEVQMKEILGNLFKSHTKFLLKQLFTINTVSEDKSVIDKAQLYLDHL